MNTLPRTLFSGHIHSLILVLILSPFLFSSCQLPNQEEEQYSLQSIAAEYNRKCPQMIDAETRIDGIEIVGDKTVVYKYTLIHAATGALDTAEFRKALRPGIISMIRLSKEMEGLREKGVTFHYRYSDKSSKPLCTIRVYPADYKH